MTKKEKISLDNWRITQNIPIGKFVGFKASLGKIKDEYTVDELNKKYAEYLNKPAFKEE